MERVKGKPVCWCLPVELKAGEWLSVVLNEKNMFDVRAVYDKAMQEPVGTDDKEQGEKEIDDPAH